MLGQNDNQQIGKRSLPILQQIKGLYPKYKRTQEVRSQRDKYPYYKMWFRAKQRIHSWGMPNGWETPKEMFNIFSHKGNANQNNPEFSLTPVRMAMIKNSGDSKCWRRCGERGILLHCWWDCRLVQSFWKSVWSFLRKLDIELPEDPAILLEFFYILDINPLSVVGLVKIFSQSVGCHFVLTSVSFALQKLCSFMRSHLPILDLRA